MNHRGHGTREDALNATPFEVSVLDGVPVIPAKAGIQGLGVWRSWIPALAGMTP